MTIMKRANSGLKDFVSHPTPGCSMIFFFSRETLVFWGKQQTQRTRPTISPYTWKSCVSSFWFFITFRFFSITRIYLYITYSNCIANACSPCFSLAHFWSDNKAWMTLSSFSRKRNWQQLSALTCLVSHPSRTGISCIYLDCNRWWLPSSDKTSLLFGNRKCVQQMACFLVTQWSMGNLL